MDIQAARFRYPPPMLDRTGLRNHGPFELGTTRDALGTTPEGGVLLGPERPRTYEDLRSNFLGQETEVPQLSSPPHTNVADEATFTGVDVRHEGAATTVTSLDTGQGSGNINVDPTP
ncbi:hypothetical protein Tco_0150118 [Tanacetum coccineum]